VVLAVEVKAEDAEKAKDKLLKMGLLDDGRKIKRKGKKVIIPVKEIPSLDIDFRVVDDGDYMERKKFVPMEEIREILKDRISSRDFERLPEKWEKFGDVLIIKMGGIENKRVVAEAYAKVLKCKTVLEDAGGIKGEERRPDFIFLYGNNAETIHVENGIRYKFDASRIMFSSGNIEERIRMAEVAKKGETVVDMFAGIGYFTLPLAIYGKAKVYACEINPQAYEYLKENVMLNGVADRVKPLLGDCREVAPHSIADRVVMGYFDSIPFFPYALRCIRDDGIIHFHIKCKDEDFPERIMEILRDKGKKQGWRVEMLDSRKVKSYAPRIIHGVIDIRVA